MGVSVSLFLVLAALEVFGILKLSQIINEMRLSGIRLVETRGCLGVEMEAVLGKVIDQFRLSRSLDTSRNRFIYLKEDLNGLIWRSWGEGTGSFISVRDLGWRWRLL